MPPEERDHNKPRLQQILRAALPVILAVLFCALTLHESVIRPGEFSLTQAGYGSILLAGLPSGSVNWYPPIFGTALSIVLNLGISFPVFLMVSQAAVYALVFCAGCLLRGYWGGIISLVGTGLFAARDYNPEQALYTCLLLLVLLSLLLRPAKNGLKYGLLTGFAVGATLLFRTPLALFPPVLILCDRLSGRPVSRAFIHNSLALLAACYVLLVPLSLLNRSISGNLAPFNSGRASYNMLTAAMGSIYNSEGNAFRLAGIEKGENTARFYLAEAAKHPLFYTLIVLRRLFHVFMFFPVLFGSFILALVLCRKKENMAVLALPVYFILLHSLFSIEKRYFYPLLGLLPPLVTGAFLPERFDVFPEWRAFAKKAAAAAFLLSFSAVLLLEVFIIAYPARAARNRRPEAFYKVLERFPNDRTFRYQKCRGFLKDGDDAGFYGCLDGYSRKFDDKFVRYFLSVIKSGSPSEIALPRGSGMEFPIARMLREFELGDEKAAMRSFDRAYESYTSFNMFRATPYRRDRELSEKVKSDSENFWEDRVYRVLLLWPPGGMQRILAGMEKQFTLSPALRMLADAAAGPRPKEMLAGWWLKKRRTSDIWAPDSGRIDQPLSGNEWESSQLSGLALKERGSGGPGAGKTLMLRALDLDGNNPEALLTLCAILGGENKKEQALDACMRAVAAAYGDPRCGEIGRDAALRSAGLLKELGRKAEAEKAFHLAAGSARGRRAPH